MVSKQLVQAVLLLRDSSSKIENRIRATRGVRNLFPPGSPWELGVVIEAENQQELMSIAQQITSYPGVREHDLFVGPEVDLVEPGTTSKVIRATSLFKGASISLQQRRSQRFVAEFESPSEDSQDLAKQAMRLDFSNVVRTLQSNELTRELSRSGKQSQATLARALHGLFSDLSNGYDGYPIAKDALREFSQELEGLIGLTPEEFLPKLRQITSELEHLERVRRAYLKNARAAGLDHDFVDGFRGDQPPHE